MIFPPPRDPLAAVTHPDPYPYYAKLAAFDRCESIGMWVAADSAAIREVLSNTSCRVRPVDEPVPRALVGSVAGEIFAELVRMRDGDAHRLLKPRIGAELEKLELDAGKHARMLLGSAAAAADPRRANKLMFELSAYTIGSALGVSEDALPHLADCVEKFAGIFAPGADPERIVRGKPAAEELAKIFSSANTIGFFSQAYEATAGLIGNVLVAIGRGDTRGDLIDVVLREDPPVQNTRRFVAEPTVIAGRRLERGEIILVVLAAANLTFGAEAHRCPGDQVAKTIAAAGVQQLLERGARPDLWIRSMTYRPSLNTRVPIF